MYIAHFLINNFKIVYEKRENNIKVTVKLSFTAEKKEEKAQGTKTKAITFFNVKRKENRFLQKTRKYCTNHHCSNDNDLVERMLHVYFAP